MKTTKAGFSQLAVGSLGIISVLLMLSGGSMAATIGYTPSVSAMKQWVYAQTLQLSKLIGETQADFAQDRLGDKYYDGYFPRISGLPEPTWHQERMSEKDLLEMVVEKLFIFKGFIVEMETHETQNKSSQFTAKFQEIKWEINYSISDIQQMQIFLGYTIPMQQPNSPHPTRKPAATQKEQDEWELGILKGFIWWLLPVQTEFHRQITTTA